MKQGVEINLTLSATFQGSIDDQHVGNAEADVSLHREQCHWLSALNSHEKSP